MFGSQHDQEYNVSISFGLMWLMCDLFVMSTCMNVHQYTVVPRTNDSCGMYIFNQFLLFNINIVLIYIFFHEIFIRLQGILGLIVSKRSLFFALPAAVWHSRTWFAKLCRVLRRGGGRRALAIKVGWTFTNGGKRIINHPFGNGLYHLFIVIWGMVYCFNYSH